MSTHDEAQRFLQALCFTGGSDVSSRPAFPDSVGDPVKDGQDLLLQLGFAHPVGERSRIIHGTLRGPFRQKGPCESLADAAVFVRLQQAIL